MLLHYKADLTTPDAQGATPLDSVRMISMQPQQGVDGALRMRRLLNEVTEMPTMDIVLIDGLRFVLSGTRAQGLWNSRKSERQDRSRGEDVKRQGRLVRNPSRAPHPSRFRAHAMGVTPTEAGMP